MSSSTVFLWNRLTHWPNQTLLPLAGQHFFTQIEDLFFLIKPKPYDQVKGLRSFQKQQCFTINDVIFNGLSMKSSDSLTLSNVAASCRLTFFHSNWRFGFLIKPELYYQLKGLRNLQKYLKKHVKCFSIYIVDSTNSGSFTFWSIVSSLLALEATEPVRYLNQ